MRTIVSSLRDRSRRSLFPIWPAAAMLATTLLACQRGESAPSKADCARLVEHVADLQFRDPDPQHAGDLARHRDIVARAIAPQVMAVCASWSEDDLACAMKASGATALAACRRKEQP